MSTQIPWEDYLHPEHEPFAKPVGAIYADAHRELALPHPATPFRDFSKLQTMTGGLRPYEFSILCGATGTGKTTFCANLSADLIRQGVRHFVASVETGATDFVKRVISAMERKDWNTGDAVPVEHLERFHRNHGQYFVKDTLFLSLYDNRFSLDVLLADLAWMAKNKGVKVAIIDNLNFFLEVTKSSEQIMEMDRVIHGLVIFCKRIDLHVIMVMHPKKTDGGRVESELDIKGSSTAVQEAHNVFLFNRPHPDLLKAELAGPGDRELMIAKMRRKGKFVRRRLIMHSSDGVSYQEGEVV
jgi:archaellum biogenesis ATPase FlaH